MNETVTVPTYSEADETLRKAMRATASNPDVDNPRAREIREQIVAEAAEKLAALNQADLRTVIEETDKPFGIGASPFWSGA